MKIKMRVNLGSADAAKMKLDYKECTEGNVVDVNDGVAERLVALGLAEFDSQKGVPSKPAQVGK